MLMMMMIIIIIIMYIYHALINALSAHMIHINLNMMMMMMMTTTTRTMLMMVMAPILIIARLRCCLFTHDACIHDADFWPSVVCRFLFDRAPFCLV